MTAVVPKPRWPPEFVEAARLMWQSGLPRPEIVLALKKLTTGFVNSATLNGLASANSWGQHSLTAGETALKNRRRVPDATPVPPLIDITLPPTPRTPQKRPDLPSWMATPTFIHGGCRFILARDPLVEFDAGKSFDQIICGDDRIEGSSYCGKHHRRCYIRGSSKLAVYVGAKGD